MVGLQEEFPSIQDFSNKVVRVCRIALISDEEYGGYTAIATRLPGVISEGDTKEEAVSRIVEAFKGAIECYIELGQEIPWADVAIDSPIAFSLETLVLQD